MTFIRFRNGFHSIPEVGVIGKISPIRFKTLSPDTKFVLHCVDSFGRLRYLNTNFLFKIFNLEEFSIQFI